MIKTKYNSPQIEVFLVSSSSLLAGESDITLPVDPGDETDENLSKGFFPSLWESDDDEDDF